MAVLRNDARVVGAASPEPQQVSATGQASRSSEAGALRPRLSVVIPVYNEQDSLVALHERLSEVLPELGHPYEIIFVDDGSTDASFEVLQGIYARDGRTRIIQFRRNMGKSAALAASFEAAAGDWVVTMDADLQDEPAEIANLLEALESGYDVVSGWKYIRNDPVSKRLPSRVFNRLVSTLMGVPLHDINCGLKIYRREVLRDVRIYGELHRFIPVLAHYRGFRVGEIKVTHHPRRHGKSKFGFWRFSNGLLDLMNVILLTKYCQRPGHFFGNSGLILSALGFLICSYLSLRWLQGSSIGTRPLLALGILLIVIGVQCVFIGLLGEMVIRNRKHEFDIKSKLF